MVKKIHYAEETNPQENSSSNSLLLGKSIEIGASVTLTIMLNFFKDHGESAILNQYNRLNKNLGTRGKHSLTPWHICRMHQSSTVALFLSSLYFDKEEKFPENLPHSEKALVSLEKLFESQR